MTVSKASPRTTAISARPTIRDNQRKLSTMSSASADLAGLWMFTKVRLDEGTHRDDAQAFAPRGLESRLDQSPTDAAASKSRRHLRVHEHKRVLSPLVVEEGQPRSEE